MKFCGKCKETLETSGFNKNRTKADGLADWCRKCMLTYGRKYYKRTRPTRIEASRKWRKNHPQYAREYHIKWRAKNKEYVNEKSREWSLKNKGKRKEIRRKYAQNNRHKLNATAAKRRFLKELATPKWTTKEMLDRIEGVYLAAQELKKFAGCLLEVDHIIPLQGKEVCGLHVFWNLQLLTPEENVKKGNKLNVVELP